MEIHTVGIDLGKTTFHLAGLNVSGEIVVRKKYSRKQMLHFTANLRVALIAGGPGTFREAVPHPAGGARRCERRPAPANIVELLLSGFGSGSGSDKWRVGHLGL
jgi:hypothetical protein